MSLDQLSLKMLRYLQVLVAEENVTRAAEKLGTTQPRLSAILSRLRHITNDPLLISTALGMKATPYSREIARLSAELLTELDGIRKERVNFDPQFATKIFRIAAHDHFVPVCIAPLLSLLGEAAPGITVAVSFPSQVITSLKTGLVDLAIGYFDPLPEDFYMMRLGTTRRACIASAKHERIGDNLTLDAFVEERHVSITTGTPGLPLLSEQRLDEVLDKSGAKRRVGMYVPSFHSVPHLVANSDMLAVIPLFMAEQAQRYCDISIFPLPFRFTPPAVSLVWHERTHNDAAHSWLRSTIKSRSRHV